MEGNVRSQAQRHLRSMPCVAHGWGRWVGSEASHEPANMGQPGEQGCKESASGQAQVTSYIQRCLAYNANQLCLSCST